jgi:hypothetical protein
MAKDELFDIDINAPLKERKFDPYTGSLAEVYFVGDGKLEVRTTEEMCEMIRQQKRHEYRGTLNTICGFIFFCGLGWWPLFLVAVPMAFALRELHKADKRTDESRDTILRAKRERSRAKSINA